VAAWDWRALIISPVAVKVPGACAIAIEVLASEKKGERNKTALSKALMLTMDCMSCLPNNEQPFQLGKYKGYLETEFYQRVRMSFTHLTLTMESDEEESHCRVTAISESRRT
jgi:hypothetical protein